MPRSIYFYSSNGENQILRSVVLRWPCAMGNPMWNLSATQLDMQNFSTTPFTDIGNETNSLSSEYVHSIPAWSIIQLCFLFIIVIFGSLGNGLVCLIVVYKRRMQNFINWLILNLSVADLAVSAFCIPLEIPLIMNNYQWIYGRVICPILYPLETVIIYVSVFTLVAMSLSRYWALLHPFKKQPSVLHAKITMCLIWLASTAVVIPYTVSLKYQAETNSCSETFSKQQVRTYTLVIFVFQYALPLVLISISYIKVCSELKRTSIGEMLIPVNRVRKEEARKVVKMLIIVTVTFAVCVLPYHLVYLYNDYIQENFPHKQILAGFAYVLLYLNSVLNPIVYNVFNENFRETLQELLKTAKAFLIGKKDNLAEEGFFSQRRASLHPGASFRSTGPGFVPSRKFQHLNLGSSRLPQIGGSGFNSNLSQARNGMQRSASKRSGSDATETTPSAVDELLETSNDNESDDDIRKAPYQ